MVVSLYISKNNDYSVIHRIDTRKGRINMSTETIDLIKYKKDEKYMKEAMKQAKKAAKLMEVPIGCVIVYEDKIIARGYNRRNTDKNTISHAEMNAIKKASKKLGDWRLEDCTMYITLEPCQMCAGAIVQARVSRVVIGSMNPKAGCAGSILNLLEMQQFNHQVEVTRGIMEEQCSQMLTNFFKELRAWKKQQKQRLTEENQGSIILQKENLNEEK